MLASTLRKLIEQSHNKSLPSLELLEGNPENPEGFFESRLLVETSEYLLGLVNSTWDHPFLSTPCWSKPPLLNKITHFRERFTCFRREPWIDKDPRICLLWTPYKHILLREPVGVAIVRNPLLVAGSLALRDGFNGEKSALLWWLYHHHLLAAASHSHLLCIDDAAILKKNTTTIKSLTSFIKTHQGISVSSENLSTLIDRVCRPDMRRAQPLTPEPCGLLEQAHLHWKEWQHSNWDEDVWRAGFERLPSRLLERYEQEFALPFCANDSNLGPQTAQQSSILQELKQYWNAKESDLQKTATDMQVQLKDFQQGHLDLIWKTNQELLASQKRELELQIQVKDIKLSTSWWITRPLRRLSRLIRKLNGKLFVYFNLAFRLNLGATKCQALKHLFKARSN